MKKEKIVPVVLFLVGLAFVLGAVFSWLDNLTAIEPVGLGKWIFDVLQFLIGAAGTWFGYSLSMKNGKAEKASENRRTQEAIRSPKSEQTMEGKGGAQKTVDSPGSKQTMK